MLKFTSNFLLRAVLVVVFLAVPALCGPISAVVVYGDSLSDNGNLYAASGFTYPPAPYFNGRRSNGPVAVETMANALGVPLIDQAWLGATTGIGNYGDNGSTTTIGTLGFPGVSAVFANTFGTVAGSLPGGPASAVFVVWAGANDFLAPSPLDTTPAQIIARAVSNIDAIVLALQGAGAGRILVPGLPDLGLTPYVQALGPLSAAGATAFTNAFNTALQASLPSGVLFFDTATVLRSMVANPAAYGFMDVSAPCFNGVNVCANPDAYLFWDDFHPSTAAHAVLGQQFANAVPEPATVALVIAGLAAIGIAARKRSA